MTMPTNNKAALDMIKAISNKAKALPTKAAQKRLINKMYRQIDAQSDLPAWNNDFNVADRAIRRVGTWMRGSSVEFSTYGYSDSLMIEMRQVIRDAHTQ